jgi:hypothetical protein
MEARGTARAVAAEEMMVPCIAAVNVSEEPEKINDRRSTALPEEGVTRGVFERDADGVCVGVAVDEVEELREIEGVGEAVSVVVDEREADGVMDGVFDGDGVLDGVFDGDGVLDAVFDGVGVLDEVFEGDGEAAMHLSALDPAPDDGMQLVEVQR